MPDRLREIEERWKIKPREDCEGCIAPSDISYLLTLCKKYRDLFDFIPYDWPMPLGWNMLKDKLLEE